MAENQQKKASDSFDEKLAQDTMKAAGSVKSAVTAAAKAGAGDVAGAIKALIQDENIRKAAIAIITLLAFLFTGCSMLIGTAITGTVEHLSRELSANWDSAWEEAAINSDGNSLYLYSIGALEAGVSTLISTIEGLFRTTDEVQTGDPHDGRTSISKEDYKTYLNSLTQKEALTGEAGALMKCINMIKGRVAQRGDQLQSWASSQYALESIGHSLGATIQAAVTEPFLFYGVESTNIHIDTSAFAWSDIQALKVLAAYAIQHDCLITDIDMWDLMEYCGWYGAGFSTLDTSALGSDHIYNGNTAGTFGDDIAGVVSSGESIASYGIHLSPPYVPEWNGNFVPQWYNEELSALLSHNAEYDKLAASGIDVSDMIRFETDADGHIVTKNFSKLSEFHPYGLIDRIYTSSNSTLTVTRTEYTGASQYIGEALDQFLTYVSDVIKDAWGEAVPKIGALSQSTDYGKVERTADGIHRYSTTSTVKGRYYYLQDSSDGTNTEWKYCSYDGATLSWTGLSGSAEYRLFEVEYVEIEVDEPDDPYEPTAVQEHLLLAAVDATLPPESYKEAITSFLEQFTTYPSAKVFQAFQLRLDLNISYAAISVDQLLSNVLGLWPGSLYAREMDASGIQYAEGQSGNDLLRYEWTDIYTDPVTGESIELSFNRLQSYQIEAYQDIVRAMAGMLGISTNGLFGSGGSGGYSIVQVAKQECEYYNTNGLSGGMRYWDMARNAGGTSINFNAAWCACFVLTCAWQCGYIGPGALWGDFGGGDWLFTCSGLYNYLLSGNYAAGYTGSGSDYKPSPGDLIFFNTSVSTAGMEHIGIVVSVSDDGVVTYIDGNSSGGPGYLKEHTAGSYAIGSYAYSNTVICAYASPYYPTSYVGDPLYLEIPGSVKPSTAARYVTLNGQSILLVGDARFRKDHMQEVIALMKDKYPELYTSDLQAALDQDDMTLFITAWNRIASDTTQAAFGIAQGFLRDQFWTDPIAAEVRSATGFDWQKSEFRENILWGIVTTSSDWDALTALLTDLCSDMSNSIGDASFLDKLSQTSGAYTYLHNTVATHQNALWRDDNDAFRNAWIKSIDDLLSELKVAYNATIGAIGDPNSSVEMQIFYYLTHSMGLSVGAACGVLANIEAESSFNPTIVGDSGTSYGLCQWHNERYTALISYCNANGLDYRTVTGQMRYLQFELETDYPAMLARLRAMPDTAQGAYDAGALWCTDFERPANASVKAVERGNNARTNYWPRYAP